MKLRQCLIAVAALSFAAVVSAESPDTAVTEGKDDRSRLDELDEIECRMVNRRGSATKARVCVPKRYWVEERQRSRTIMERRMRTSEHEIGRHSRNPGAY